MSACCMGVALHIWKLFFVISFLFYGEIVSTEEVSKHKSSEDLQLNYEKRPFCNAFTGCYYRERREECNEQRKRVSQFEPEGNNNLLMFRVPDSENSSEELLSMIVDLLNQSNKKFNLSPNDFESCYRLGKRCEGKDRPVRLIFKCFKKKQEVLKSKKALHSLSYSEDLPKSGVGARKVPVSKPSILDLIKLLYRENTMNIPTEDFDKDSLQYLGSQQ